MFVSIPPTQLDKPVTVLDGLSRPFSIAVNSMNEIIVAENTGNNSFTIGNTRVSLLDREGKRLKTIEHSQHKMKSIRDIAIDDEDNIFVIDGDSNIIGKFNRNCDVVKIQEIKPAKGRGRRSIAVAGQEVMTIDCSNEGQIVVYDRELNLVRHINGRGRSINKMSVDCYENIYITENDCIQVFKMRGDFVRSFSCLENGITHPHLIHASGQYIYVPDHKKTLVFTTEGKCVASFGCYGAMCVDNNGFVYICDSINSRINIY